MLTENQDCLKNKFFRIHQKEDGGVCNIPIGHYLIVSSTEKAESGSHTKKQFPSYPIFTNR